MGYYTRVFCKSNQSPAFNELEEYMRSINLACRLEGTVDESNDKWTDFELYYKEGKLPLLVELSWTDEEGSLGEEEINEFLEEIGSPGLSFKKRKVINHLKQTKFIVCNQLPTSDIDDDGYTINGEFLKFFVDKYQGMFQADGEGFYNNDKIIVKS